MTDRTNDSAPSPPSFEEALATWARIGWLSFGGPAGQIALMHRVLVIEKRWIGEERFLHALNFCMLLPGPEAQQLATYVGWLMHGTRGGLVAGVLFVLPGFIAIMALSFLYVAWGRHVLVEGVFLGLKAAVIAIVIQALLRIGSRALGTNTARALALLAFVAIAAFGVPFPLIVLAAALCGYLWTKTGRYELSGSTCHAESSSSSATESTSSNARRPSPKPNPMRNAGLLAVWLPLWLLPVALLVLWLGPDHVLPQVGIFFSKMAVVTFGGAYAVLTYVAQQAVESYRWLTPTQMLDGLGLAETTPGPLIMVVQFVGFLAAYQTAGQDHALVAGVLAACLTVWVTFVPCFLWIFLGAPYIEVLRRNQALSGALSAVTAAVVGVIANLALWFALHALFERVTPRALPLFARMDVPDPSSIRWPMLVLTVGALWMTFGLKWSLGWLLAICAALGVLFVLLGLA